MVVEGTQGIAFSSSHYISRTWLTYTAFPVEFGSTKTVDLIPSGCNIAVTKEVYLPYIDLPLIIVWTSRKAVEWSVIWRVVAEDWSEVASVRFFLSVFRRSIFYLVDANGIGFLVGCSTNRKCRSWLISMIFGHATVAMFWNVSHLSLLPFASRNSTNRRCPNRRWWTRSTKNSVARCWDSLRLGAVVVFLPEGWVSISEGD